MDLVEIRDLDGPNLFALRPAIKLEVSVVAGETVASLKQSLETAVADLHREAGLPAPTTAWREMDTPGHHVLAYDWEWRQTALLIAQVAFDHVTGGTSAAGSEIQHTLERDRAEEDRPLWVRDDQRHLPCVGITGTNGKTTTTRLVAHILRTNGKHVGWSSSSGVYIDGELVIEGDYTGPSGARRVLNDPSVDIGVLETARGGILLRGLAYESNDVGVFLNVSADHLDMQGVATIETLAEVKGVVVRVTRPGGLVVLNADDPLVLAQRNRARADALLFSQNPANASVISHIAEGGRAIVRDGDRVRLLDHGRSTEIITLADAPMTFGGRAKHMVENLLAASGAALGLGLTVEQVAEGLRTFRSDLQSNAGRLNVFALDGRTVVVDYAHNESGLEALIAFTRSLMGGCGRLAVIVGTAGDRQDSVFDALGRIAAEQADQVYLKENLHFLRGREAGAATRLMRSGIEATGLRERLGGVRPGEHEALLAALEWSERGDAIAIMCVEEQLAVLRALRDRGAVEWNEDRQRVGWEAQQDSAGV